VPTSEISGGSTSGISSLAALVRKYETGSTAGNYTILNQSGTSTASGAYQFTNPTWRSYASQIGVDTKQYPTAASAPPSVQDAVFVQAVKKNGLNDWTCEGCNPALTSHLANNPGDAYLPISDGGTDAVPRTIAEDPNQYLPGGGGQQGPGTGPSPYSIGAAPDASGAVGNPNPGIAQPGMVEGVLPGIYGGPFTASGSVGVTQGLQNWMTGIAGNIETNVGAAFKTFGGYLLGTAQNLFIRLGLIIVGLLLLGLALWTLLPKETRTTMVRAAA
jgi:hypothetical protein